MALSEQDVFVLSERTLSTVIDQIQDQQWDQTTPDWFQTGRQGKVTLRTIINYHAFDRPGFPMSLQAKPQPKLAIPMMVISWATIPKEATAATVNGLLPLPST